MFASAKGKQQRNVRQRQCQEQCTDSGALAREARQWSTMGKKIW